MRYLIKFSYDGSNFHGYQKQNNLRTVQEYLENAVSFMNKKTKTQVHATSRTDKGVHAKYQVAHFDMDLDIDLYKVKTGLNSMLPDDIHIFEVSKVSDDFHARYMAKEKTYKYYLNTLEYDPINRNYCYQYCKKLDLEKMNEAIKVFVGEHDFRSFISSEDKRENTVRIIYSASVSEENGIITFTFSGNGFMKYQIRNMVACLIDVGSNKKDLSSINKIMELKNRTTKIDMVPGAGLYLVDVKY